MSSKPLQVKDKVFYWQEDKSKIRSDGSKGGIWLKGKVISIEGAMVGLDLGTRLIKVNMTKVRRTKINSRFFWRDSFILDETIPPEKPGIDLLLPEERESLQKEPLPISRRRSKRKSSVPLRIAGKTTPKPAAPHPAENMFVEDLTSVPEQAQWNCVRKGKIYVLEIFARFSQCCALSGLKVGALVDIRTGFDVMTSKGRHVVMEIIREQAPDVILMAPVCGPWSNMQNIQQDQRGNAIFPWLSLWHPLRDIS